MKTWPAISNLFYHYIWDPAERSTELFWTFFYHEMLKRTTTEPLQKIAKEDDSAKLGSLFREWSQVKSNESKYIQVAVWRFQPDVFGSHYRLMLLQGWLPLHISHIMPTMEQYPIESLVRLSLILLQSCLLHDSRHQRIAAITSITTGAARNYFPN